ncbi:MAG: SPOR domain-containing protein [Bacteroidales bacterium]|nr:SPOR domain-containing protein [Bacteroidales bacterium]
MKKSLTAIILLALPVFGWSQSGVRKTSICDQLRQSNRVTIHHDSRLEALLTREAKVYNAASHLQTNKQGNQVLYVQGYRVRVFSGNKQVASRNEALKIEADLKAYNPELETYVLFKSPNWRLLVGNFRTREEATALYRLLKKQFPVYGQEMFVVKEQIEIPIGIVAK